MNGQRAKLLRVFINQDDRYHGKPLYEAIVDRCRELKVAGATAFRPFEGFGETAELHYNHLFRDDQPIVITIVERPDKAEEILPVIEGMMNGGIVAVTDVEVTVISKGSITSLP